MVRRIVADELFVLAHNGVAVGIYTEEWRAEKYAEFLPGSKVSKLSLDEKPEGLRNFDMPLNATQTGMYEVTADLTRGSEIDIFKWHNDNEIPIKMIDCGDLNVLTFAFEDKQDAMNFKLTWG